MSIYIGGFTGVIDTPQGVSTGSNGLNTNIVPNDVQLGGNLDRDTQIDLQTAILRLRNGDFELILLNIILGDSEIRINTNTNFNLANNEILFNAGSVGIDSDADIHFHSSDTKLQNINSGANVPVVQDSTIEIRIDGNNYRIPAQGF